ncbi:MAG: flagellar hook-basal body complex protein FliE [Spirochaetia bacterium]
MMFLDSGQLAGDFIQMRRLDPRHLNDQGQAAPLQQEGDQSFSDVLVTALDGVNDLQQQASQLGEQMILDPESVDSHDVTIAMAEANMALSITKAVTDRALRAYKEIISIR